MRAPFTIFERCQCHQNSIFSPLCHEQWEKARVEACGVEPHQVLRLQRSALPVELSLHNHIKKHIAESRVFETHAKSHTQFSRLVPSLKDLLSIWAENGARTRNPDLGKVVLCQLSYFCMCWKGGIRTPEPKRERIYSPLRLATSLPFNIGANEAVSSFILHRG